MTSTTTDLLSRLRAAGAADVAGPLDDRYPTLTAGFDLAMPCTPDAVVAAVGPADVVAAIRVARESSTALHILGTGHGRTAQSTGGIAVNTEGLAGVVVDPATRTARIGAGTTWQQVLEAAAPFGLAAPCGSAPGVGVVGLLLGGGLGPLARAIGFSSDLVRSFEIVTAAGDVILVTAEEQPDLFWALRGGRTGFGVVLAVTVSLLPVAEFYGGGLYFPATAAREVLHTWAAWSRELPESVTTSVAVLRLPDLPFLPPPLRGQFTVHVRVAALLDPRTAEELLAPLRAVADPLLDNVGLHPYDRIALVHADPVAPMPVHSGSTTLSRFDGDVVDALLAVAGPQVQIPIVVVEVRQLGGATARQTGGPDAVGGRDVGWNLFVTEAPLPDPSQATQIVQGVLGAFEPWRGPTQLINFLGNCNTPRDVEQAWTAEQHARLDGIRRTVDPGGLFSG